MGKQITPGELAEIVTGLLVGRQADLQLDTPQKYGAFMTDIAKVICDHCGGEVQGDADSFFDGWMIGITANDSLPDDGGIWAGFDPEGELFSDENRQQDERRERALALGFESVSQMEDHQQWLSRHGTPEYKAWAEAHAAGSDPAEREKARLGETAVLAEAGVLDL
ncbi:MAG: hypothetical protein KJ558_10105 [Gammaproteobacteria bacterium]|nr:hypothetical protein [Gammaproteobacteria bacterium]MBU1655159.1 hypothetical protein [Gammaproteobacteria bacterium]MBU1959970.1 hypothetical protein [Gammaproteobacteria bacterium]